MMLQRIARVSLAIAVAFMAGAGVAYATTYDGTESSDTINGTTYTTYVHTDDAISGGNRRPTLEVLCPSGAYPVGGGGYFNDSGGIPIPLYQSIPLNSGLDTPPFGWRATGMTDPIYSGVSGAVYVVCAS